MGTKQSTPAQRPRTFSGSGPVPGGSGAEVAVGSGGSANTRLRARSLGHFSASTPTGLVIPGGATAMNGERRGAGSPDSDSSTPEEGPSFGRTFAQSLPLHLFALQGIKCPVCAKFIPPEEIECHLVICLTKPRISYNEDVLVEDKGECVICFDELEKGDTIARLPCLCVYHKGCIDKWFEKNRSCPEHPSD
ncbi:E3 ubiquitin-protein ligase ZNRF2-like isoform X2 [Ostrea edulis]|uniref:E3 ubiquitin-protein ligase ZNRF2-like isoform X2 n=1 Tax=Ostrea edulis TaxID=37623 RepID=UPI002096176A|nr:E3 ubiquitin-protein ligase ZNRF2-like isoform X2 [Ostrea edulis]